jgi:ribosomal protein L3 glutamine methyltransferase
MTPTPSPADDLLTVRDWLRYAVSRFNEAKLVYGHGTETALDEAAFLILATLHLAVDDLEPWLEARLTGAERRAVFHAVDQRVTTRKPASYITGVAYIAGQKFHVDERVIVPRSYIGELLARDAQTVTSAEPWRVNRILDLCTGSGCLAVLAALEFPNAAVDAVDISQDALDVARINVADYGLEDRVRLVRSDLFKDLAGERYDIVLSNPPYVTTEAVAAFPPEYRAEPQIAHLGGNDGLDIVRRILKDARAHLNPGGTLVVEVGQANEAVEAAYPELPFLWLDTETSEGEVFSLPAAALAKLPATKTKLR